MNFEAREMKKEVMLNEQSVGFTFWNGTHVFMKTNDDSNSDYPNGVVCLTGDATGEVDCFADGLIVWPAVVKLVGDPK